MNKRHLLGCLISLPLVLAGCGGGSDAEDAQVRVLNVSPGYASLDLYVDDDLQVEAAAYGSATSFKSVPSGDVTTVLTSNGSTTELLSQSRTLSSGDKYSIIAFGWEGALKSVIVKEDEDAADAGKSKVSVFNGAADAGELDVYLTGEDELLSAATPVASSVDGAASSAYSEINSGTYRLRVTAADDSEDVRLDVSGVTLDARSVVTLVLSPGSSGVLVNAMKMVQGGSVVKHFNTQARARVVAAVGGTGTVSLSAGATTLATGSKSPTIRDYVLMDAGELSVATTVNGTALASQTMTVEAGSDVTFLVTGSGATDAQTVLISDDNRLPTSTTKYKLRLVHASPAYQSDGLTLTVDYTAVASDLAFASASSFSSLTANSSASLEVYAPSATAALYSASELNLVAEGVYTLFMFDNATATTGVLRKDR